MTSYINLLPGDPAPWFHQRSFSNPTRLKVFRALVRASDNGLSVGKLQNDAKSIAIIGAAAAPVHETASVEAPLSIRDSSAKTAIRFTGLARLRVVTLDLDTIEHGGCADPAAFLDNGAKDVQRHQVVYSHGNG